MTLLLLGQCNTSFHQIRSIICFSHNGPSDAPKRECMHRLGSRNRSPISISTRRLMMYPTRRGRQTLIR